MKTFRIEIKPHATKPKTYVASYRSPILNAVYQLEFSNTITGAVALHHFVEMLKTRIPAESITRFVIEADSISPPVNAVRDALAMESTAS